MKTKSKHEKSFNPILRREYDDPIDDPRIEVAFLLLMRNVVPLSAVAWRGYHAFGRGAVRITADWSAKVATEYVAADKLPRHWDFLERYRPAVEFIVIVARPDSRSGSTVWKVNGRGKITQLG